MCVAACALCWREKVVRTEIQMNKSQRRLVSSGNTFLWMTGLGRVINSSLAHNLNYMTPFSLSFVFVPLSNKAQ